jgi:hypothetical protein
MVEKPAISNHPAVRRVTFLREVHPLVFPDGPKKVLSGMIKVTYL